MQLVQEYFGNYFILGMKIEMRTLVEWYYDRFWNLGLHFKRDLFEYKKIVFGCIFKNMYGWIYMSYKMKMENGKLKAILNRFSYS